MNILYCGDRNIEKGLIISILSIMKNVKEQLNIYVLTAEFNYNGKIIKPVRDVCIEKINEILKEVNTENSICKMDISDLFKEEVPLSNMETRFTPFCMLRLFADKIDSLPSKILYLDNDVVARQNFTEFYNTDMENTEFAGVLDFYGRWFFRQKFFKFDYINSGVLLLNLEKIRETKLFEKARKACIYEKMFMPDQSSLNNLATNKKIMPRRFNEQRRLKKDTVLQHFTTSFRLFPIFHAVTIKPWDIENLHKKLKNFEYDDIIEKYLPIMDKLNKKEDEI